MVQLGQTYKTEEIVTTASNNVWIKDGWHKGVIVSSEIVDSLSSGKPQDVLLRVVVTEGEYKDTELEHRLSLFDETPIKSDNPTWTWARAALGTLGQIAKAVGVEELSDTASLHNKPVMFETKTKEGKDKATGQSKPEWNKSQIYGYKAVSSSPAAIPQPQTAQQQALKPAQAAPAKPWASSQG